MKKTAERRLKMVKTKQSKVDNLSGQHFGYWTVLQRAENSQSGSARWLCRCECGKERIVRAQELKRGKSKSCGCHKNDYNRTHGGKGTRLYECWRHMRYRCSNPNNQAYKDYGGRGIQVCREWQDFAEFKKWALANGYTEELTIDRIDVNGDYRPDNCRWVNSKTQMNNRRTTPKYAVGKERLTLSEWSQRTGIPRSTIWNRLRRGLSFEEAIEY